MVLSYTLTVLRVLAIWFFYSQFQPTLQIVHVEHGCHYGILDYFFGDEYLFIGGSVRD